MGTSLNRPVNLNLTTLNFPITAIVSILHRISGITLFILLPYILYYLQLSLKNRASFTALKTNLSGAGSKIIIFMFLCSIIYHFLAGIRHIIMDMGYGEDLQLARTSAMGVIALTGLLIIFLGFWIW